MSISCRIVGLFPLLFASGFVSGCGSSKPPGVPDLPNSTLALNEVGEMYRVYEVQNKKAPTKSQDFRNLNSVFPLGFSHLNRGDVVAQWGVTLSDLSEGGGGGESGDEVLAYEKLVPEQGGQVLMKNRTVKTMTPEEFKAAPKAGGS